jgi:two-component system KDP operon response regulator KdpE
MDGQKIISLLRAQGQTPIIVLSARDREQDKVAALEAGADDYLTKPFGVPELLARLKVALRHARQGESRREGTEQNRQEACFTSDDLMIDFDRRQVRVGGEEVRLTPIEYKLLAALARQAGRVMTHQQLMKAVWGRHSTENSHYLRIYARLLRRKLGDDPCHPRYIFTETGIGYRLKAAI